MANRSRRPRQRQRQLPALAAQTDANIGSITGKHCDHSQCGRARTLMEQLIMRDGPGLNLDSAARRRIIARVPHMLCTPGRVNLINREYLALVSAFIFACEEVQVSDGWLGHQIPGYEAVRAGLLAAAAEQSPEEPGKQ